MTNTPNFVLRGEYMQPEPQKEDLVARAEWLRARYGGAKKDEYAAALVARRAAEPSGYPYTPMALPGPQGTANWTPIGPSVTGKIDDAVHRYAYSGRVSALAAGPSGTRVYAGAANGGVWLHTEADGRWVPLSDYQTSPSPAPNVDALSVGALAVRFGATQATDIIYIGTGDQFSYFGIGVLRSINGGGTWTPEASVLTGKTIARMAIDPDDGTADRVVAATSGGIYTRSGGTWIHSTNGFDNGSGTASDVIVVGSGGSRMFYAAFTDNRVYACADPWTQAWIPVGGLAVAPGRLVLGGSESDPSVIYAYRADATCYRLVSGSFVSVSGAPAADVAHNWYHLFLGVDPTDPDIIYLGGLGPYRAVVKKQGQTWSMTPADYFNVHVDFHAVAFASSNDVWFAGDGGVYQTIDPLNQFSLSARNVGLANILVHFMATRADTDAVALIGTQDIGVHRFLGEPAWVHMGDQADGGGVAIDPSNPYRMLMQHASSPVKLLSSLDGGGTWTLLAFPGSNDPHQFVSAIRTTPAGAPTTLAFFGTHRLWMTNDWGNNWVVLPSNTANGNANDLIDGTAITAIAVPSATRVYVATASALRRYDGPGTPWNQTNISSNGLPASRYITSLAQETGTTFYAGLSSSSGGYLYYYDGSWHSANFTSAPVHAVVVDPDNLMTVYIGTDVGVWRGTRSNLTWTWNLFSAGLPESGVVDLQLHQPTRLLRAATYGRGVWEVNLEMAESGLSPQLYVRVDYADNGRIRTNGQRSGFVEGAPDPMMPPPTQGILHHWKSPDIKVRRLSLNVPLASPVDYLDYATHIDDWVDTQLDHETADITGNNQVFIEIHNRAPSGPADQVNVLALITDASVGLPPLPSGWVDHVNNLDTNSAWLAQTEWYFLDLNMPFRPVSGTVDVRNPGIVLYDNISFAFLNLPSGHDHVCIATFVTALDDLISSTAEQSLDVVTMQERHVAHRNVHLVAAGAKLSPSPGPQFQQSWQVVTVFAWNPFQEPIHIDLVFDWKSFHGQLAVAVPLRVEPKLEGFYRKPVERLEPELHRVHQAWFAARDEQLGYRPPHRDHRMARKLERLARLDGSHLLVSGEHTSMLRGLRIEPQEGTPLMLMLRAPRDAKPGERFPIDVMQHYDHRILGGSTFVLSVYRFNS